MLILQVPRGSRLAQALEETPPAAVVSGSAIVEFGPADSDGNLEPPLAGRVVLSVPSPETLAREPDEVRRVLTHAADTSEPLVIVVEDAEELRDDELAAVIDAAASTRSPMILRVIRGA